jgi:hypothetical protein
LQKADATKDAETQALRVKLDAGEAANKIAVAEMLSALETEKAKSKKQVAGGMAEARVARKLETQLAAKAGEIELLKASIQSTQQVSEQAKQMAVRDAVGAVERERDELKSGLERSQLEKQLAEQGLKDKYETQIKDRDDAIERLRDMKARLSTKRVGETLEQHCATVTILSEMKRRAIRPRPTGKMGACVASNVRNRGRSGSKRCAHRRYQRDCTQPHVRLDACLIRGMPPRNRGIHNPG